MASSPVSGAAARPKAGTVTITRQPVTLCELCSHPVTYKPEPGAAAAALTAHYVERHGKDLALT